MQITCEKCGQPVEVTEEEAKWKTMCRKCFAISKQGEQKNVGEFEKASLMTVEKDVALLIDIAKQLSYNLNKKIEELSDGERAWVSTIYIQRRRNLV